MKILECVPNFSEGQNNDVIQAIANSISAIHRVKLLDRDSGFNANRTVYTFAGEPNAVIEAAFEAIKTASINIDMRNHKGTHPRMGACDVCPLIPITGMEMEEAVELANKLGQKVAKELNIPVFLYENAASVPERKNLAWIRKGEYEGLESKLRQTNFLPDYGKAEFSTKSGIATIGARSFLIAFNVNLATKDVAIAKQIASQIREKSMSGLRNVKAIGWHIAEFDKVQVSTNITDFNVTPVYQVFEAVQQWAAQLGTEVTGSELVGMIPIKALSECGVYFLKKRGQSPHLLSISKLVEYGTVYLNLKEVKPFEAEKKIIECALNL